MCIPWGDDSFSFTYSGAGHGVLNTSNNSNSNSAQISTSGLQVTGDEALSFKNHRLNNDPDQAVPSHPGSSKSNSPSTSRPNGAAAGKGKGKGKGKSSAAARALMEPQSSASSGPSGGPPGDPDQPGPSSLRLNGMKGLAQGQRGGRFGH